MSASKSTSGGTQAASRPSGNTRTQQQAASSNYINTIIGTSRSKPTDSEIKNAIKRVLEVCPDWQEEDILHVLESHNYDSSQAASAILDGSAGQPSQWQDVNKKTLKPAEKGRKEKTGPRRDVQNNGQRREGNFRENNGLAGPRQPRRDDLAAAGKGPRGPLDKPRGPNVKGSKTYLKGEPIPVAQETIIPATTELTEAPKPALEPLQGVQNAEILTKSQPTATQAATGKQPLPKQTTQPATTVAPTKPLGGSWSKPPSSIFANKTPVPVVTPVVSEKSTPSSRLPTATPLETKTVAEPLPSTTLTETKWPTQTSTPAVVPLPATSTVTLPPTTTVAPSTSATPGAVSTTTTTISTAGGVPVTLANATTPVTPTAATPIEPTVADALPAGRRNEQYYNTSNLLKNQWKPKDATAATPVAPTKNEPVVAAASNPSTSPLLGSTTPTSTSASLLNNSTSVAPKSNISPSQTASTPAKHGVTSAAPSRVAFQSTSPVTLPAHANLSSTYDASHFGQFGSFGGPQTQQPSVIPPAAKKTNETANTYGDIAIRNRTNQGLTSFDSHLHPSVGHEARASEHNVQNIEGYHDNNAAIGNLDGDNVPTPAPYSYVHPGYMPYPQGYGHYEPDMRYYDGGYPYGQAPNRAGELPTDNKFQGQEAAGYDAKYGQESTTQQPGVQSQPQAGQMPVYSYHNAPYYYGSPYHQGYPAAYGVSQPYGRHYYQNSRPYGAPMTYPNSPYNPEEMTDYKQQQQFMQGSFMPNYGAPTEGLGKGQQGQTPSAGQTGGKNTQSTYTPAPSAPPSGPSSSDLAAFGRNPTQQYKSFASQEQQSFYNVQQQQQYGHQGPAAYGYAAPHNYPNSQRNSGQYGNQ